MTRQASGWKRRRPRTGKPSPYGSEHRRERARQIAALTDTGAERCWRCTRPIYSWQPLVLGHLVDLALGGRPDGPRRLEHRDCSNKSGSRLGAALSVRARRRKPPILMPTSRPW